MRRPKLLLLAVAATLVAGGVQSASAFEYHGYFRVPLGGNSKGGNQVCFKLPGADAKYRLGNECDFYGEFFLSEKFNTEGVETKIQFTPNLYNGGTDSNDAKLGLAEMFVEGKGFDIAPEASFWVGKRYYARADVHIVDTFFTIQDGVGAGVRDVKLGPGKFALAYFRSDDGRGGAPGDQPGSRISAELYDIAANPGGTIRLI